MKWLWSAKYKRYDEIQVLLIVMITIVVTLGIVLAVVVK